MKKTAILLFCIFFLNSLFAQNYTKKYSSFGIPTRSNHSNNKSGTYATNDNGSISTGKEGSNLNVVKLNNTGCIVWSMNYDFGTNSEGSIIKQLLDTNYLVCGTAGDETIAMKIDGLGNVIWAKKYDLLYGTPLDFAQKGSQIILLAGADYIRSYDVNSTLIKIDETNGNLINSKIINRIPVDADDADLLCRFTRILSTGSGYVLGGQAIMNKYITDPLLPQVPQYTPIMVYLDMAGNVTTGNYFSEGEYVKEIIQQRGDVFTVAIENRDWRYYPSIVNSEDRLTILRLSISGIWWQKTYVNPITPISYITNNFVNNMAFTNTGDILVTGFIDRGPIEDAGNYIFKIDTNGHLLSSMLLFNNGLRQASTGLKITPTNEFVVGNYSAGIRRFTANITASLCDYITIPLDEYDDTLTEMFPINVVEIAAPINAITVAPTKTTTIPTVTNVCGTVTPTFTPVVGICEGAPLAALPTTSIEGILGTWSAALDDMATTTYTFTPNSDLCNTTTLTITVNPIVNPKFNDVAAICSGDTLAALPLTSLNGITGTWSPALNNLATTTYTFTPSVGQCATTTTLTITVNPTVTPTFAPVATICLGAPLAALPTTSIEGITGTWSPALNNLATTTYTFTPNTGQCATTATLWIGVNPIMTPTFTPVASICVGATLLALPTTSLEGIAGTWSPALNNLATTTYTFTPNIGQCATTVTLTITVNPIVTPTFKAIGPICSGGPLGDLPTISQNAVEGTWSPALNNTTTTTYTFTPNIGQCATTTTLTIAVNPIITPIFTPLAAICSRATLAALPLTSLNGITGTWSPALNNLATTTYTFMPTDGQCATSTTLTITVNPIVTPIFTAVAAICSGATLAALPLTSLNGITGTWSPALNNLATTTYTFTPTVGQCATTTTLTITVNPKITPTFTPVAAICAGTSISALPRTSTNGISGTWSPALNNLVTTTYTFTPSTGLCATTTTLTITVNPIVTPTFTPVASICSGATLAALPLTSLNGITGTWSPALNNLATTTYTFTPSVGQCARIETLSITVNPILTPIFTAVAPIRGGAFLAALPLTSLNGITGTWSPALNNLVTTTYTFTPNPGQCGRATTMRIVVLPFIVIGTLSGGDVTVCASGTALDLNANATVFTNSTMLTLTGNSAGLIIEWQKSLNYVNNTNATASWSTVANTTTNNNNVQINGNTLTVSNLTSSTWYRVKVIIGSSVTFTDPVKITVTPLERAGAISCPSTVCYGGNITFASLAYTGSAIAWEVSTTSATTGFSAVAGQNGLIFNMTNVAYPPSSRFYVRSVESSGGCSIARSSVRTITVNPISVAGTVTGAGTVCSGSNGIVRISSCTGSIQWMYSTDGTNFSNVPTGANTAPTFGTTSTVGSASSYLVSNITGTTYFKAAVKSGLCSATDSNVVEYTISASPTAGTASSAAASVCAGGTTTISLSGQEGTIKWQKSTNYTATTPTWSTLNTSLSATLLTGGLTVPTAFRAMVSVGACSPPVYSNKVVVLIKSCNTSREIEAPLATTKPFDIVAYPNPSNDSFNLTLTSENEENITLLIYDMTGKMIEQRKVNPSTMSELQFGSGYNAGIYNLILTQGMETKTLRVIKK